MARFTREDPGPSIPWGARKLAKKNPKPVLQTPLRLPSDALADLINSSNSMEASLDKWRKAPSFDGKTLRRIQDCEIWRTLKHSDGSLFFDNSPTRQSTEELRIGVAMGFDGCVSS